MCDFKNPYFKEGVIYYWRAPDFAFITASCLEGDEVQYFKKLGFKSTGVVHNNKNKTNVVFLVAEIPVFLDKLKKEIKKELLNVK